MKGQYFLGDHRFREQRRSHIDDGALLFSIQSRDHLRARAASPRVAKKDGVPSLIPASELRLLLVAHALMHFLFVQGFSWHRAEWPLRPFAQFLCARTIFSAFLDCRSFVSDLRAASSVRLTNFSFRCRLSWSAISAVILFLDALFSSSKAAFLLQSTCDTQEQQNKNQCIKNPASFGFSPLILEWKCIQPSCRHNAPLRFSTRRTMLSTGLVILDTTRGGNGDDSRWSLLH